jgi:hypothetical protein
MADKIAEIDLDIAEVKSIILNASRTRVQEYLAAYLASLKTEKEALQTAFDSTPRPIPVQKVESVMNQTAQ